VTQKYKEARSKEYATSTDFCRLFDEQMTSLYLLSLLLTADPEKAEQCFVSGMGDSLNTNSVFKEWAHLWARRSIIQNAIRLFGPRLNDKNEPEAANSSQSNGKVPAKLETDPNFTRILLLNPFERFVFVMSVLEAYSDQECSLLLGCLRRDVADARIVAIKNLADGVTAIESQAAKDVIACANY
jgi:hypothetical protein